MDSKGIMVTIRCITYNHELYIRQCLEGFVMQKTNFRFVAIVHDDASTDGNADIIREYAKKYPNIIRPILQTENQHSKGFKEAKEMLINLCLQTKYVAYCEGDDYWTDPFKLQKQFDFMEANPEYAACFHQSLMHFEGDGSEDILCGDIKDQDYTGLELYSSDHRPPTASFFFKSEVLKSAVYKNSLQADLVFGDVPLFLSCAHEGKVRGMSDVMSVYRKHQQGMTNTFTNGSKLMLRFADSNLKLYKIFGNQYKEECTKIYVIENLNYFFTNLHQKRYHIGSLIKVLLRYPITTIHFIKERI